MVAVLPYQKMLPESKAPIVAVYYIKPAVQLKTHQVEGAIKEFLGFRSSFVCRLKFRFSKKATNFETISHLIWEIVSNFCGLFITSELYSEMTVL